MVSAPVVAVAARGARVASTRRARGAEGKKLAARSGRASVGGARSRGSAVVSRAEAGDGGPLEVVGKMWDLMTDGEEAMTIEQDGKVLMDPVQGSKRFSNYFWATAITGGASGFLVTGLSSYLERNLIFFLNADDVQFFPQGLVLSFYGTAGLLLATYLWLTIYWDVGSGYNEFNKESEVFRVFRRGFPGKNRRINLTTPLEDVTAVKIEIVEGVNPRRVLYVQCKGKRDIPLTRIGTPMTIESLEKQGAQLARFLNVPIVQ